MIAEPKTRQTGALLLDGNTINYFGKNIPINLVVVVIAEIVLVGSTEYYRIINGLVNFIKDMTSSCFSATWVTIEQTKYT